jgi:hypothetical protein
MRLGVSYNVFDGVELLKGSILSIRGCVDYVNVIYQTKSNYGMDAQSDQITILNELFECGLINKLYLYEPDLNLKPWVNELNKRQLGLELNKLEGCTHHISMDCDEYYIGDELNKLKTIMIDGDYDSSFLRMFTYYKSTKYVLKPKEDYYVSCIHKIYDYTKYIHGYQTPLLVDPTRRITTTGKFYVAPEDVINMHHLSHIRLNYKTKLINSSAYINYENKLKSLLSVYENFTFQPNMLFPNDTKYKIVYNDNDKFNVEL